MKDRICRLIEEGERELSDAKNRYATEAQSYIHSLKSDKNRVAKKIWASLESEARIDLEEIVDYVDLKRPDDWSAERDRHWLLIKIPNLSEIAVEYRRYCDNEWYLDRFVVSRYEKVKIWVLVPRSLKYALAMAKESYQNKPKGGKIIPINVEIQELDDTVVS